MSIAARLPTSKMSWVFFGDSNVCELEFFPPWWGHSLQEGGRSLYPVRRGCEVSVVDFRSLRSSDGSLPVTRDTCSLNKFEISGKMEFSTFHGKATSVKIRFWFFAVNRLDDNRISWFSCRVTVAGCLPLECTSPLNTTAALGYVVYLSCADGFGEDFQYPIPSEHDFPYVTTINGGYIHLYTSIYPILRPTQIGYIYIYSCLWIPWYHVISPFISPVPNFHG